MSFKDTRRPKHRRAFCQTTFKNIQLLGKANNLTQRKRIEGAPGLEPGTKSDIRFALPTELNTHLKPFIYE